MNFFFHGFQGTSSAHLLLRTLDAEQTEALLGDIIYEIFLIKSGMVATPFSKLKEQFNSIKEDLLDKQTGLTARKFSEEDQKYIKSLLSHIDTVFLSAEFLIEISSNCTVTNATLIENSFFLWLSPIGTELLLNRFQKEIIKENQESKLSKQINLQLSKLIKHHTKGYSQKPTDITDLFLDRKTLFEDDPKTNYILKNTAIIENRANALLDLSKTTEPTENFAILIHPYPIITNMHEAIEELIFLTSVASETKDSKRIANLKSQEWERRADHFFKQVKTEDSEKITEFKQKRSDYSPLISDLQERFEKKEISHTILPEGV